MVVGQAPTLGEAREISYDRVAAVEFERAFWRTDIAAPEIVAPRRENMEAIL